jgi:hypothetical protein
MQNSSKTNKIIIIVYFLFFMYEEFALFSTLNVGRTRDDVKWGAQIWYVNQKFHLIEWQLDGG